MAFDQAKADEACAHIAAGKSLRQIEKIAGMPADSTIVLWAHQNPAFAEQYASAMRIRAGRNVDRLEDLRERVESGDITPEAARVAADLIKWPASKLIPKVFGDRIAHDVDGKLEITVRDLAREDGDK